MSRHDEHAYARSIRSEQVYENPVSFQIETDGAKTTQKSNKVSKENGKLQFAFMCVTLALLSTSVVMSVLIYISADVSPTIPESDSESTTNSTSSNETDPIEATRYISCLEWKNDGFNTSGIYTIQPDKQYPSYQVYCDMVSDGGGWTMVASIHEDSMISKCSSGDKWSLTIDSYALEGPPLWSNTKTTGSVESSTSEDFKSKAYFLPASDVLMSHVPNDVPVEDIEKSSFLVYHTSDGFLTKYGSSLQSIYRDHTSLTSLNMLGIEEKVVHLVNVNHAELTAAVPDWYNYTYDAGEGASFISNGGDNMFNTGNKVSFSANEEPYILINYGETYTDSKTYQISSAATLPFITLATVTTNNLYLSNFRIKVESTIDTSTSVPPINIITTSVTHGSYFLQGIASEAVFAPSTGRPTICKFFFYLTGYLGFSRGSYTYRSFSSSESNFAFEWEVSNNPTNVLVGYMLLSRQSGSSISTSHLQDLMTKFAEYVDSVNRLDFMEPNPSITVPVSFAKGSVTYKDPKAISGFLQFSANDKDGASYALCPGVRLTGDTDPALYCVGWGNTKDYDLSRCGDFAAWDQLPEHYQIKPRPDGSTLIVNDIHSTILIFTR